MMRLNPKLGCFLFLNLLGVATMLTIIVKQYTHISTALTELKEIKNTDIDHQQCFVICQRDYSTQTVDGRCCTTIQIESSCKMKTACLEDYIAAKKQKIDGLFYNLDCFYGVLTLFISVSVFFICKICNKPRTSLRRQRSLQRRAAIARLILHLNVWSQANQGGPSLIRRTLLTESYISQNKEEQCAVCLDCFKQQQVTSLSCGHIFHFKCAQQWIQYSNSCPVCRARQ